MDRIDRTISVIREMEGYGKGSAAGSGALAVVTLAYLVFMLSVPVGELSRLLWFALYPLVMAPVARLDYNRIFVRSLMALPFTVLIGIFNPLLQTETAFSVGGFHVSRGWLSFVSINVRGILSLQALLILVGKGGFSGLCRAMERGGVPSVLTTQLLMVYRYMTVLLEECQSMSRARKARGFMRRNLPLRMWGALCGQLFIRSVERSKRIHACMLARGFTGKMPVYGKTHGKWQAVDYAVVAVSLAAFCVIRFVNLSAVFINP